MKYSNTSQKSSTVKRAKTYNSRNSRVVTHRTTTLPVYGLSTAERTGCSIFHNLWSYVLVSRHFTVYQNWARQIPPTHRALSLQEPTVLCSRYNRIMVSLHHSFDCKSIMLFLQGETRDSSRQSKAFITRQVTVVVPSWQKYEHVMHVSSICVTVWDWNFSLHTMNSTNF